MNITIPYYEDNSRISNSMLGYFLVSPKNFKEKVIDGRVDSGSGAMDYGTMVHCYLLQPDEFKKLYRVLDINTPSSAQQKAFCQDYIDSKENRPYLKALEALKKNYKVTVADDDKNAAKGLEIALKYKSYIKYLRSQQNGEDKFKYISWATLNSLRNIRLNILEHKKAKELLFDGISSEETHNEFHINWDIKIGDNIMDCKSLIDRVKIDHENKKITLIDVKTTVSVSNFYESFEKYDYARQLCYYWAAIYWYFKNELDIDVEEYSNETYIVAIQNNGSADCRVFRIEDDTILAKNDIIKQTLTKIDWHRTNNKWDFTKEYYEGDGSESLLYA